MRALPCASAVLLAAFPLLAQDPSTAARPAPDTPFSRALAEHLPWRNLGPANPMGRMTDIAIHPRQKNTWYVGSAGGGVWKTSNAGTTWTNVFDRVGNVSIGDIAIAPSDPEIVWVGTGEENARNSVQWGDGVYKSTDGGATWTHAGLRESFQIGHIAIHPKNPDIVFVAALGRLWGENPERGIYRTKDGGKSWERVLFFDDHTGGIDVLMHPGDPNTVFACLYERKRDGFDGNDPAVRFGAKAGLYKSTDGGDNWRELTAGLPTCRWGRSGIDILASRPDTMFAIVESERSGWAKGDRKDFLPGEEPRPAPGQGPGGGRPGGNAETPPSEAPPTQQEEGQQRPAGGQAAPGQPTPPAGRAPRNADLGIGQDGDSGAADAPGAVLRNVTDGGAAALAGLRVGDRITKVGDEAVKTYGDLLEIVRDAAAGTKATLTYVRGAETRSAEVTYGTRANPFNQLAGRPNGPYSGRLFGQDADVQDKQGELGFETGGVFRSDDRGENWRRVNSLTERPFYYSVIRADPRNDQNLYCVGTTLWGTKDGGASFKGINNGIHVDFHACWVDPDDSDHLLALCDGGVNETLDRGASWQVHRGFCAAQYYDAVADNSVPYNVVGGLQDNGTWVIPSRTRYREGIGAADCVTIYGGDGFGAQTDPLEPWIVYATSQNGAMGIVDMRSGQQARLQRDRTPDNSPAQWNWDAPFILSPHNRLTVYHAGTHVFRGERYAHLDNRQARPGQGPLRGADTLRMKCVSGKLGRTEQGTAVAIAESPRVQGLLYVGTDDGALWRTEDGCASWHRIDQNIPVFGPRYVSDLVPSHFADNRVYMTLDGHRSDDFATYVLVSEDRGNSWRDLGLDLPTRETCYAVMEDPRNEDLLLLGTEYGAHVSFDRGDRWFPLGKNLPIVAVRDLFIQDRDSDLIAATHGRGVWVLDIEALRQVTAAIARKPAHLFAVEPAILWRMTSRGYQGNKEYAAPNPPYGVTFHVWLAAPPKDAPVLTVHDVAGAEIARVTGQAIAGLQPIQWDARSGRNQLARPGTYAVRWANAPSPQDVEPRVFNLLPDPAVAAAEADTTAAAKE
ncbi:MAG: PDZ domain-containing protein [Pirellulales bacterium]